MKRIFSQLALLMVLAIAPSAMAQEVKYQLSSHILDITAGQPAPGVEIKLSKLTDGKWMDIASKKTDVNGRIKDFLPMSADKDNTGVYKLTYYTAPYFAKNQVKSFYPFIEVVFQISDKTSHYHVPITLSPFGYSTYRGN